MFVRFLIAVCLLVAVVVPAFARPKKSNSYPPKTVFDTLPDPPFHLFPLLAVPSPPYNLSSPAKVELGRALFFDPRLSRDGSVSCASCHNPALGFSDGRPTAVGIKGQKGVRNSPSLYNVAYNRSYFLDGRAGSLEEQVLGPIQNPIEMGEDLARLARKLNGIPGYRALFKSTFGTEVNVDGIAQALAAFERTILSNDSRFDRFMAGDEKAMTAQEIHGLRVFNEKAKCVTCHNGPNFTDGNFHALGLPERPGVPVDLGRYNVSQDDAEMEAFKTPSLRSIAESAPYMHNGMFATLEEVVEFYVKAPGRPAHRHPLITPLTLLSEEDKKDLIAFIKALTGEKLSIAPPPLPK